MSDERNYQSSTGRPATTIWEHYRGTRLVLFVISATFVFCFFIPAMLGAFLWIRDFAAGVSPVDSDVSEHLPFILLILFHSFLLAGLSDDFFGRKRLAFRISLVAAALWLIEAGVFGYNCRNVSTLGELMSAGNILVAMILFVAGLSVFFITYLLWRTNVDQGWN